MFKFFFKVFLVYMISYISFICILSVFIPIVLFLFEDFNGFTYTIILICFIAAILMAFAHTIDEKIDPADITEKAWLKNWQEGIKEFAKYNKKEER